MRILTLTDITNAREAMRFDGYNPYDNARQLLDEAHAQAFCREAAARLSDATRNEWAEHEWEYAQ